MSAAPRRAATSTGPRLPMPDPGAAPAARREGLQGRMHLDLETDDIEPRSDAGGAGATAITPSSAGFDFWVRATPGARGSACSTRTSPICSPRAGHGLTNLERCVGAWTTYPSDLAANGTCNPRTNSLTSLRTLAGVSRASGNVIEGRRRRWLLRPRHRARPLRLGRRQRFGGGPSLATRVPPSAGPTPAPPDDASYLAALLGTISGPIVLVGHSSARGHLQRRCWDDSAGAGVSMVASREGESIQQLLRRSPFAVSLVAAAILRCRSPTLTAARVDLWLDRSCSPSVCAASTPRRPGAARPSALERRRYARPRARRGGSSVVVPGGTEPAIPPAGIDSWPSGQRPIEGSILPRVHGVAA